MAAKADWPALRPDGALLAVTRAELIAMAVQPFVQRTQRETLTAKLFLWMDEIAAFGVPLTLWIDGSYGTHKEEPNDIDMCVLTHSRDVNALEPADYVRFSRLLDRSYVKASYALDLILIDTQDQIEQGEWKAFFGKGHDRTTVKGLFVMKVTP